MILRTLRKILEDKTTVLIIQYSWKEQIWSEFYKLLAVSKMNLGKAEMVLKADPVMNLNQLKLPPGALLAAKMTSMHHENNCLEVCQVLRHLREMLLKL
ncbi:MAG: hypothetical protein EZS28_032126 [Streblomastix strix]|uniref:Uncharacterized protein n=1 Tax=Streblomastix strix TaxID=222440 RepID=A0A5J4UPJ7_9EUKA|nr:MAG: hypothetical protein EZS28_032126 [Streblomastix strix]